MPSENHQRILEKIDEIIAAMGQPDYEAFRSKAEVAAVLFANLGSLSAKFAAMSRHDLVAFIDGLPPTEQEHVLRLLTELEKKLPMFGTTMIEGVAGVFPKPEGGKPPSFKDRESKRQACSLVLEFIRKGFSEAEAKRHAAKKLGVSPQTVNRTWKQRTELATEGFEELMERFLRLLSAQQLSSQIAQTEKNPSGPGGDKGVENSE